MLAPPRPDPGWRSATRQKEDARFVARFLSLPEREVVFLLFMHHVLLSARKRFGAVGDAELVEVVSAARKTLDTRQKGILYNHPSSSPHLDRQAAWILEVLTERRRIAAAPEASDTEVLSVLGALEEAIRDHQAPPAKRSGYLDTAESVLRGSLGEAPEIDFAEASGDDDEPDDPGRSELIVPP